MKLFRKLWFWLLRYIRYGTLPQSGNMRLLKRLFWYLIGIIIIMLSLNFIVLAYEFNWPGAGFRGKTVWDWLQLLIIPLVLTLVALLFNQASSRTERQIASDKQKGDLLQAYLDRMSELLLEKGLRTSQPDAEVRNVARAHTINVLTQLDAKRVAYVLNFLREAGLADASEPVISLRAASLSDVKWEMINLSRANLSGIVLTRPDLSKALLVETNLRQVGLVRADLRQAILIGADFSGADLAEADFSGANLAEANLSEANLSRTNLKGANIDKSQLTPEQVAQAFWDEKA